MLQVPIEDINESHLQSLVTEGRQEDTQLEFKLTLPGKSDDEKREFLKTSQRWRIHRAETLSMASRRIDQIRATLVRQSSWLASRAQARTPRNYGCLNYSIAAFKRDSLALLSA